MVDLVLRIRLKIHMKPYNYRILPYKQGGEWSECLALRDKSKFLWNLASREKLFNPNLYV